MYEKGIIDQKDLGEIIAVQPIGPKRVSKTFIQESQNEIDIQEDDNRSGPIVQNENIGTNKIGRYLMITESAFFNPTDAIRIPIT